MTFHSWPTGKRGGSDLDRCPECQQVTFVRRQQWDGSAGRWRRPNVVAATCASCQTTWELAPIEEHGPATQEGGDQVAALGRPRRLAIVGSRSLQGNPAAWRAIRDVLDAHQARCPQLVVVSGGARGIDRMAAAEARRRGLQVVEHMPRGHDLPAYRERDQRIAQDCDHLVRIADRHSRTYGSGWTRDRARELGKPTEEIVIDSRHADRAVAAMEAER